MFSKNNLSYLLYLVFVVGLCAELIGQYYFVTDGDYIYLKKRLLFVGDEELGYKFASNITIHGNDNRLYPGVEIKTNGLGLRSLPIDNKKKHILVLGDSVSFGYGVNSEETFSELLQNELGESWQVINAGIPGYNVGQYEQMWMRLRDSVEFESVIIMLNANDAEPRYSLYQAGMTLRRASFYPWEQPQDSSSQNIDTDAWILPRILQYKEQKLSRDRRMPATKNTHDQYMTREQRKLAFWNVKSEKSDVAVKNSTFILNRLVRSISDETQQVIVARYPWPVTLHDPKLEDKRRGEWGQMIPDLEEVVYIELYDFLLNANLQKRQFLYADDHPNASGHKTIAEVLCHQLVVCN